MFSQVIMIDWSARNSPSRKKHSKDAIWTAFASRSGDCELQYQRTRHECQQNLIEIATKNNGRILVGLDFPFGYPCLNDGIPTMPTARALCEDLADRVSDDDRNRSNRFEVAKDFNRELSRLHQSDGPFWGCPKSKQDSLLRMTRPSFDSIPEYRFVESHLRISPGVASPKSAWQLHYAGCVGSQALLGLAMIGRLLRTPLIRSRARIWPFETGWGDEMTRHLERDSIVFAEVYPSLVNDRAAKIDHPIHDARQVKAMCDLILESSQDELTSMFMPPVLSSDHRRLAREHEGWILGAN